MNNNLVIQSLNRFAKFGHIYDIKNDSFINTNIYHQEIYTKDTQTITPVVDISYFSNKTLQEKLKAFNITNDYQKICMINGSINKSSLHNNNTMTSLVVENNSNSTMITGVLVFRAKFTNETLDLSNPSNRTYLRSDLSSFKDLYYVSQIKFGLNVVVIFERQEFNETKRKSQQKQLDVILNSIQFDISLSDDENIFIKSFNIRVEGLGSTTRMGLPNISSLKSTMLSTPNGVPIEYTITPVANILTLLGQVVTNPILVSVSSNVLDFLLSEHEKFQNIITLLKLYIDLYADYQNYVVLPASFQSLMRQALATNESKLEEFKSFATTSLPNILSLDIQPLKDLFYHQTLDYIGSPDISFTKEIDFVTKWQQNESMSVLAKDQNKLEVLEACRGNYDNIYILHYSFNFSQSSDFMESFMKFYYRNVNDGNMKSFFILVDLELHGLPITDPYVEHYHGKISNPDFNISNNYNYVQYLSTDYGKVIDASLPYEKTMMCPGRFCSTEYRKWKCANCLGNIKIQSLKFYCDCGSGIALDSQFKCFDPYHESDNSNGKGCYSNTIYKRFNNKNSLSILSLLPNYIKSSDLVSLSSPINFSVVSDNTQNNILSTVFKNTQSTYKINDIIKIFNTTAPNNPNLNIEPLIFPTPAGSTISQNYLKQGHSLCFILNGSNSNDSPIISHIIQQSLTIFSTRSKIFLLNINPNKNGNLFNYNTPSIADIARWGSFQEFFIDVTRLSNLLKNNTPLDKLQVQETLIIWKSILSEFKNLSNQILTNVGISTPLFSIGYLGAYQPLSMNTTLIKGTPNKPKFYTGQIQTSATNTPAPLLLTSLYSTQYVIKFIDKENLYQLGAIKIYEPISNPNWVFKFRLLCSNPNTFWADGIGIVLVPTGSTHYSEEFKDLGSRLGYQYSLPKVCGINMKVPYNFQSPDFEVTFYSTPGPTETSVGTIVGAKNQILSVILVYSFDNILTLFVNETKIFSRTINLQSILGNQYYIALNTGCGSSTMDIFASEFYFYPK